MDVMDKATDTAAEFAKQARPVSCTLIIGAAHIGAMVKMIPQQMAGWKGPHRERPIPFLQQKLYRSPEEAARNYTLIRHFGRLINRPEVIVLPARLTPKAMLTAQCWVWASTLETHGVKVATDPLAEDELGQHDWVDFPYDF
jgi:hypothetical protein